MTVPESSRPAPGRPGPGPRSWPPPGERSALADGGRGAAQLVWRPGSRRWKQQQAARGGTKLSDGLVTLSSGADQLDGGIQRLEAGSESLALAFNNPNGVDLVKGSTVLVTGLTQIQQGLAQLDGQLPAAKTGLQRLRAGVDAIVAGLGTEDDGSSLIGGMKQISAGLGNANDGAKQIQGGLGSLAAQLPAAQAGVDAVKAGLDGSAGDLADLASAIETAGATEGCTSDPVCAGNLAAVRDKLPGFKTGLDQASGALGQVSGGLGAAIRGPVLSRPARTTWSMALSPSTVARRRSWPVCSSSREASPRRYLPASTRLSPVSPPP